MKLKKYLDSPMNDIYMQNILDHYKDPENYGELEGADLIQEEFNPFCGDKVKVFMVVKDGVLKDVQFVGSGCAISQASMSMLSDAIKGKSVDEVLEISADDVTEMLGVELGPTRLKCALLGWQAVRNGLG